MYYCAYGSNINWKQSAYRCPHSKVVGVGWLIGFKLRFNVHADIWQTLNKNDVIPVLIWDIAEEDWSNLDRYEGFPKYYIKSTVTVEYKHKAVSCIVYVMSYSNSIGNELPDEYYYNIIAEGYKQNHIPLHYLHNAILYTVDRIEKHID